MIRPWAGVDSKLAADFGIFKIRTERRVSPRTGAGHDFQVIDSANWVNVIAVTAGNELVMIEQYRHGTNTVELEIPGGMIDAEDASVEAAGARELREETGYEGEAARVIGSVYPNPAIMSNTCYTVMVKNCGLKHPVEWDHGEDIVTKLVPVAELRELVAAGKIRHSLVVAALHYFELLDPAKERR